MTDTAEPVAGELVAALSEVARSMQDTQSMQATMDAITHAAVGSIEGATHAAITLVTDRGRDLVTKAATDPLMEQIDRAQFEQRWPNFIARARRGTELEQWEVTKRAASEAIVATGGTITHHHAVGRDHAPYMRAEVGETGLEILRAVKERLDPTGIMNPGKLLP